MPPLVLAQIFADTTVLKSPLPGGAAAVFRFFLNVPQWLQIGGAVVGAVVAAWLAMVLWRRRAQVLARWQALPRGWKAGLAGSAAVLVLTGASVGAWSWHFMQTDNGFCTSCHVMQAPVARMVDIPVDSQPHARLNCHACHKQGLMADAYQLYMWVAERPIKIEKHAVIPNQICEACHVTGSDSAAWQNVRATTGHRVHLESDSSALADVQCTDCHGRQVHSFVPSSESCQQSGCHENTRMVLGRMAGQADQHCTTCHDFTLQVPRLARRDSASASLRPGSRQCFACHQMQELLASFDPARDPHDGKCGLCHDPHQQERPVEAIKTCRECHTDVRDIPFHTGAAHRSVVRNRDCSACHQPHTARVDASDCTGCHAASRSGGLRAPLPFDTSAALRRAALDHPEAPLAPRADLDKSAGKRVREPPLATPPPAPPADTFEHARHTSVACITCHDVNSSRNSLRFQAPRGCQVCHHQAPSTSDCAGCHASVARRADTVRVTVAVASHAPRARPVVFAHASHASVRCQECHAAAVTLTPDTTTANCQSCHDQHHAQGRDCAVCHQPAPDARQAHAGAGHEGCNACHESGSVSRLVATRSLCLTCHQAQRDHEPADECVTCHMLATPVQWTARLQATQRDR